MSFIVLIVVLCLIVLAFWANNEYINPWPVRMLFNVVLMVILVALVLKLAGFLPNYGPAVRW